MQQAKALSEEQVNAQTVLLNSNFATKQDVAELRADMAEFKTEIKQDMAGLRTELKQDVAGLRTDMAESKAELMKWVVTMNLASAALIVTLIKVL